MANPTIGSGVHDTTKMANTSAQEVYDLLVHIQPSPRPVREIMSEVGALLEVLQTLSDVDPHHIGTLKTPLQACDKICKDLAEAYKRCMQRSSNNRENLRIWFQTRIGGKTIDESRALLASYTSTLSFALGEINL